MKYLKVLIGSRNTAFVFSTNNLTLLVLFADKLGISAYLCVFLFVWAHFNGQINEKNNIFGNKKVSIQSYNEMSRGDVNIKNNTEKMKEKRNKK